MQCNYLGLLGIEWVNVPRHAGRVLRCAVGGDPVLMTVDHRGERLEGREPLPLQARPPSVEEAARAAFDVVVPELTEGFLE